MYLVFFIEFGKIIGGGGYSIYKFAEGLSRLNHQVIIFVTITDKSILSKIRSISNANLVIFKSNLLPLI